MLSKLLKFLRRLPEDMVHKNKSEYMSAAELGSPPRLQVDKYHSASAQRPHGILCFILAACVQAAQVWNEARRHYVGYLLVSANWAVPAQVSLTRLYSLPLA